MPQYMLLIYPPVDTPPPVDRLPRWQAYTDSLVDAGVMLANGRLHLAAYALGASASGMTFLDSQVPALLGEPDDLASLLFTCVGVPEYVSQSGGTPGAPVEVRPVVPRLAEPRP